MQRPTASVVVLAWNAWERTQACLDSVLQTLGPRDELVVVDNGSSDGTEEGLRRLASRSRFIVSSNVVNLGFAAGCNQGASIASGEVLVFLNSDTLVAGDWLERLLDPFEDPLVGAAGPRSNFVSGPQKVDEITYEPGDLVAQAGFSATLGAGCLSRHERVGRLVGFCLAVRASCFKAVGGFDLRFEGGGYEDDDLCLRLSEKGYALVMCNDSYVHHFGHASFQANGVDWVAAETLNRDRFVAKHARAGSRRGESPLVSLCMIVRDEADMLPACLESAKALADEVVVYDTGSADETVEVARRLGATVLEGFWDDDFSRARNAALESCAGRWVLWLDADEVLAGDPVALRARLAGGWDDVDGYVVRIENLHGAGLGTRSVHVACRVFKSASGRWTGRLHEQVVDRSSGEYLRMARLEDVHIVHHGYLEQVYRSRHKSERNLRLAEAEVAEDAPDRPYALMNLGRSRLAAGLLEEALPPLEEACATSANPTVRRSSQRVKIDVLLGLGRTEEALAAALELRAMSASTALADIAEARCRLRLGQVEEALRLLESVEEVTADDDGFEHGPHTVAAARAAALAELGRWGEAADIVLQAMRDHGALDLHVGHLCEWLLEAGRDPAEIAEAVPAEGMAVIAAQCLSLPEPMADLLLEGMARRFPGALAPLAAAARIGPRLPVARALAWSARLRRAGLDEDCPLVRIASNKALDPRLRLRAAAAAYGSFGEPRVVGLARQLVQSLGAHPAIWAELGRISPLLVGVIAGEASGAELIAINVGCGDDRRPGYVNVDLRPEVADVVADASALPFPDGAAREVMALDLLEHASTWEVPKMLAEWHRVLAPRGRLALRVPNLEVLCAWIAAGDNSELAVRNLYGGHRFGSRGAWDAHHTGWTPALLADQLARAGFSVRSNDLAPNMTVVAESVPSVIERRACGAPVPAASVVIPLYNQAEATRRCLASIAGCDAGADYEVVLVDNGSTDATRALLEGVRGDVTVIRNGANLGFARACNQGARVARAPIIVFLNNDTEARPGWLGALVRVLERRPEVAAVGSRLVFPDGRLQHAGVLLRSGAGGRDLDGVHRGSAEVPAGSFVDGPADLPAVTGACMAVRASAFSAVGGFDEGYWNGNEDLDLCLALGESGWKVAYEPASTLVHHESSSGPERWRRVAENRQRLADRWAHRVRPDLPGVPGVGMGQAGAPGGVLQATAPRTSPGGTGALLAAPRVGALAVSPLGAVPRLRVAKPPRRGGLNVIGYLEAAMGMGEAARLLVGAAEAAGVPVSTVTSRRHWSVEAVSFRDRGEPFEWDTTLVVANADQHLSVVEEAGVEMFRDRYIVGMWFWELSEPSAAMAQSASLLHEVWVGSEFVAMAVRQVVDRPVAVLPLPVPHRAPSRRVSRADIRMPAGFVFAGTADFNSTSARKNPAGLISAFREAFRPGEGPTLYLKTMNGASHYPRELAALMDAAAGRPDIVLVDEVFDADRAWAVTALADCFVSLHRSEGLGLGLAEAMAVGTPVVATGYSGNLEFMNEANSFLVPYDLGEVPNGIPPYRAGAKWAEPDVEAAASILRSIWVDPDEAQRRAEQARKEILLKRSPEAAGEALRRLLRDIAWSRYGAGELAGTMP